MVRKNGFLALLGAQWGDEGKGKIVDYLTDFNISVVGRAQGGNNAGHTVEARGKKFILRLIPSGILHPKTQCFMGNGMVINPIAFCEELSELESAGISCTNRLWISGRAHLVLSYHMALDEAREYEKGAGCIGTTKRGIGPAYEHKAMRIGLRAGDLVHLTEAQLSLKIREVVKRVNMELRFLDLSLVNSDELIQELLPATRVMRLYVTEATTAINYYMQEGRRGLIEGAQGAMLDIDHGSYPFVTSSHATIGGVFSGLGISPEYYAGSLGITKAYTTRVGSGPFPSELLDDVGNHLREKGREFGSVTGRARRCGWFDAVVVADARLVNGFSSLAITKLDILDELDEINVCVGYKYQGGIMPVVPYSARMLAECKPEYVTLPGWLSSTAHIRKFDDLPENAREYLRFISERCGAPISLVSVGPDREQTILCDPSPLHSWLV